MPAREADNAKTMENLTVNSELHTIGEQISKIVTSGVVFLSYDTYACAIGSHEYTIAIAGVHFSLGAGDRKRP